MVSDTTGRGGRRPTLRDVAAAAGVSFKTVSRVVNHEPGVSPTLVARVEKSVAELGFRPHAGASTLRRADGRSGSIALLVENVANPFSAVLLRAVEDVATEHRVVVLAASLDEQPARERELVGLFATRQVDGMILVPASDDQSHIAQETARGIPVVCVDRVARGLSADSVVTTNEIGSAEAVRHLASSGHRRIAYLGDVSSIPTARDRLTGYQRALSDLGLPIDPSLVAVDLDDTALADGVATRMLTSAEPPTAMFTAQNLITIGAIRALRRLGLHRKVAVIGFDDFPLADLLDPPVTVVAQDVSAIGHLAAQRLFSRMAGDTSPHRVELVPTKLVRRGSGEIAPPPAART
jgi:LacI family transcriptional regulator